MRLVSFHMFLFFDVVFGFTIKVFQFRSGQFNM